jgi:hypothetical protein
MSGLNQVSFKFNFKEKKEIDYNDLMSIPVRVKSSDTILNDMRCFPWLIYRGQGGYYYSPDRLENKAWELPAVRPLSKELVFGVPIVVNSELCSIEEEKVIETIDDVVEEAGIRFPQNPVTNYLFDRQEKRVEIIVSKCECHDDEFLVGMRSHVRDVDGDEISVPSICSKGLYRRYVHAYFYASLASKYEIVSGKIRKRRRCMEMFQVWAKAYRSYILSHLNPFKKDLTRYGIHPNPGPDNMNLTLAIGIFLVIIACILIGVFAYCNLTKICTESRIFYEYEDYSTDYGP